MFQIPASESPEPPQQGSEQATSTAPRRPSPLDRMSTRLQNRVEEAAKAARLASELSAEDSMIKAAIAFDNFSAACRSRVPTIEAFQAWQSGVNSLYTVLPNPFSRTDSERQNFRDVCDDIACLYRATRVLADINDGHNDAWDVATGFLQSSIESFEELAGLSAGQSAAPPWWSGHRRVPAQWRARTQGSSNPTDGPLQTVNQTTAAFRSLQAQNGTLLQDHSDRSYASDMICGCLAARSSRVSNMTGRAATVPAGSSPSRG